MLVQERILVQLMNEYVLDFNLNVVHVWCIG